MAAQHHQHLRKRISRGLEPYPARSFWMRVLDRTVFVAGVAAVSMAIPQIVLIYNTRDASGISAISWFAWACFNIPWILYGIAHREYSILLTYSLWFLVNTTIFIGALLYG